MTSLAYFHDCHCRYDERSIVQKKITCFPTVRDQLTDQCHELDQHSVQKNRFVTSTWSSEVQLFVESEERSLSESESETWHLYLSNSDV